MKIMKKMAAILLALCLTVPGFAMLTYAADGKIMFTDPSASVGETLELKGVIESDEAVGYAQIIMTYDTSVLKFVDGDNVTETGSGQLTYNNSGATGTRVEYLMHFEVLKEGTTKVEVQASNIETTSQETIDCREGSSTITIGAGETVEGGESTVVDVPEGAATVEVNGVSYTFSSDFAEESIPEGFVEGTIEYDGTEYKVVENGGITLGYLVDANGAGQFFLYNSDNATFAPYTAIEISESTTIALLYDVEGITLPDTYTVISVTMNGIEYPAWQNDEEPDFCILYAVNNNGEKSLYKFDYTEGTYQRYEAPEVEEKNDSFIGKLSALLENHLDMVILVTGLGFIFFIIIIIVLAVKLFNRNAELDEIYDEYGIGFDDDEEEVKEVKRQSKREKKMEEQEEVVRIDEEVEEDVLLDAEEETEDEDSEIEVEFYEQEPVVDEVETIEEVVEVEEVEEVEDIEEIEVSNEVESIAKTQTFKVPMQKVKEENFDEEEEFYDEDDDLEFEMDFIDLDD